MGGYIAGEEEKRAGTETDVQREGLSRQRIFEKRES